MIWQVPFSQKVTLWILAAAFVLGSGIAVIQRIFPTHTEFATTVTNSDDERLAFKAQADSIMRIHAVQANAPININTATAQQLESLNGIGPALAANIIKYRTEHGPFRSVEELDKVSGIGLKRLAAIRERCTVDSL